MKKLLLIGIGMLLTNVLFSQKASVVDYYNWSNPVTFQLSPSPIIKGYGYYSDSLSKIYNGDIFYEHNNEYYCIESWADYYYWFTKEYWYKFQDPSLYEFYYLSKNDYGMTSYISSNKYLGKYYPSLIILNFADMKFDNNRLNNEQYFAINERKIKSLNKQLHPSKIKDINYPTADLKNHPRKERAISTTKKNSRPFVDKPSNIDGTRKFAEPKLNNESMKPVQPPSTRVLPTKVVVKKKRSS